MTAQSERPPAVADCGRLAQPHTGLACARRPGLARLFGRRRAPGRVTPVQSPHQTQGGGWLTSWAGTTGSDLYSNGAGVVHTRSTRPSDSQALAGGWEALPRPAPAHHGPALDPAASPNVTPGPVAYIIGPETAAAQEQGARREQTSPSPVFIAPGNHDPLRQPVKPLVTVPIRTSYMRP